MKYKMMLAHMRTAENYAKLSHAIRLQVGAIVVKNDRIISIGYNGTPAGWDNNCEDHIYTDDLHVEMKTKPEVIHAEANAIAKLAKSNESGDGAYMFITHAPCLECAKLIYSSGISIVYYKELYRSSDGLDFLLKCGVGIEHLGKYER